VVFYCLSFNLQCVVSFDWSMSFEAINYNNLASLDELNAAHTKQRESWKKIRVV